MVTYTELDNLEQEARERFAKRVLMSVGIGAIAANNGRNFLGWTALAMLISPLLGLIAVLIAGKPE